MRALSKIGRGLVCAALFLPAAGAELSPAGLWKTIDDKTGSARGYVRIYEQNGQLFGKIERAVTASEAKAKCESCTDERRNMPVVGMVILRGLKKIGNEYVGGDILDPDTGWIYRCKMHMVENGRKLILRGYLGFSLLGRSQTWIREP